jgi:hypothetical protein
MKDTKYIDDTLPIKKAFISIIIASILFLIVFNYQNYKFDNSPLSADIYQKIALKENYLRQKIKSKYGLDIKIPIKIVDKIDDRLFGLATYDKEKSKNKIVILLNKNRFKESQKYMIEYVLPHEYAHAMMFVFGDFTKENAGNTKRCQQICYDICGIKCDRFVKHDDIIMGKLF